MTFRTATSGLEIWQGLLANFRCKWPLGINFSLAHVWSIMANWRDELPVLLMAAPTDIWGCLSARTHSHWMVPVCQLRSLVPCLPPPPSPPPSSFPLSLSFSLSCVYVCVVLQKYWSHIYFFHTCRGLVTWAKRKKLKKNKAWLSAKVVIIHSNVD